MKLNNTTLEILAQFEQLKSPKNIAGMARFGIVTNKAFGICMPYLRNLGKEFKYNHELALDLWYSGYHEARILATLIENPNLVTEQQLESWVLDINSWDICDQCCSNLIKKTSFAYSKAKEWSARSEEFVKRAGFVLMACLAVGDKKANNEAFTEFFPFIINEIDDSRNFVKKAINWALRQIGKRNTYLHQQTIELAENILINSKTISSKWIATDTLRELKDLKIVSRIKH